MDFIKVEGESVSETYLTSSDNESQLIDIKEEVEEEDHVFVAFLEKEAKNEVSCTFAGYVLHGRSLDVV
jgi:hypothetical protein